MPQQEALPEAPVPTFYRVEKDANQPQCQCERCVMWTIVSEQPRCPSYFDQPDIRCRLEQGHNGPHCFDERADLSIQIGTSWQGEDGKEAAQDVCDLMNIAFEAGQEHGQ